MADEIQLTIVIRPPEASKAIAEHLLAGTYDPSEIQTSDIAADAADVKAVTDFAASHDLKVVSTDSTARTVRVSASAAAIKQAFGITPEMIEHGSVEARDFKGPLHLPSPLDRIVIAVLGLDQTPIAKHHGS